jgi:spermidine synthase
MKPFELLAEAHSPDGTTIELRRRDHEYVILAGGGHLMSSRMHGSEESLATLGCRRAAASPSPSVLIGGLGMGYTLRAALNILPPRATVIVAELIPEIVEWNRGVLGPLASHPLKDSRVRVEIADVAALLARHPARITPAARLDAILLDIDNGPGAFTDSSNSALYNAPGVAAAHASLKPGGTLVVWSAESNADRAFERRLRAAKFTVQLERARSRANRGPRHTIYIAQRLHSHR